jgi:hypothetical protein
MGKAARKLNIALEDTIYSDLERLVPSKMRQDVINEALRKELEIIRRKKAASKLLSQTVSIKKFSGKQITGAVSRDRGVH